MMLILLLQEFYVDGTTIPEVDFDVGPSWSGLLPISSDPEETRKASPFTDRNKEHLSNPTLTALLLVLPSWS